jgi:hypothetical protein
VHSPASPPPPPPPPPPPAPPRTAPHRTAPHRTAPHRTAPHRTTPRHTSPCHIRHLQGLSQLELLDVAHNSLTSLAGALPLCALAILHACGNPVAALPCMTGLTSLSKLSLDGCPIDSLSCKQPAATGAAATTGGGGGGLRSSSALAAASETTGVASRCCALPASLRRLSLRGCALPTPSSLAPLCVCLPSLGCLSVEGNPFTRPERLAPGQSHRPPALEQCPVALRALDGAPVTPEERVAMLLAARRRELQRLRRPCDGLEVAANLRGSRCGVADGPAPNLGGGNTSDNGVLGELSAGRPLPAPEGMPACSSQTQARQAGQECIRTESAPAIRQPSSGAGISWHGSSNGFQPGAICESDLPAGVAQRLSELQIKEACGVETGAARGSASRMQQEPLCTAKGVANANEVPTAAAGGGAGNNGGAGREHTASPWECPWDFAPIDQDELEDKYLVSKAVALASRWVPIGDQHVGAGRAKNPEGYHAYNPARLRD